MSKKNKGSFGSRKKKNVSLSLDRRMDKVDRRMDKERKCWKIERSIKDGNGKIIRKVPNFNTLYWKNPNYVAGVSTKTSKEMMEHFIKTINYDSGSIIGKEETFAAWFMLLGMFNTTKDRDLGDVPFVWFSELEYLITNDRVFFMIFHDVWVYGSDKLTNVEEMLSRYGRSNMSINERTECYETFNSNFKGYRYMEGFSGEFFNDYVLNNVKDEEYITLYRGFKVTRGKRVRLSNDRNNPDFTTQVEGKGWSYSLSKTVAAKLGSPLTTHHYLKYCGIDDEETAKTTMEKCGWSVDHGLQMDGYYSCMGEYRVKKKNLIIFTDETLEKELIVNPKDVELIDYYFMNIIDHLTVVVLNYVRTSYLVEGIYVKPVNITNQDELFDVFRPLVKNHLDKHTGTIQKILTSPILEGYLGFGEEFLKGILPPNFNLQFEGKPYSYTGKGRSVNMMEYQLMKDDKVIKFIDTRKNLLRPVKEPMLMEYHDRKM